MEFLVFADLHYKKRVYAAAVEMLETILRRAAAEGAEFVLHLGDLCCDYKGSPEIVRANPENSCGLPVYGVYGNHELETKGNDMALSHRGCAIVRYISPDPVSLRAMRHYIPRTSSCRRTQSVRNLFTSAPQRKMIMQK